MQVLFYFVGGSEQVKNLANANEFIVRSSGGLHCPVVLRQMGGARKRVRQDGRAGCAYEHRRPPVVLRAFAQVRDEQAEA
jgi:hypothetical protein